MNWKKVVLFIFLVLVGIILFGIPPLHVSLFQPLFFIVYVVFLSLIFKEYSKKKLFILIGLVIIYLAIMLIPFPTCDSSGGITQKCTCIGLKKHPHMAWDAGVGWTQCIGIPINVREIYLTETVKEQIKQQIADDLRSSDKKLSFPNSKIVIKQEQNQEIIFGVKNIKNNPLTFAIETEVSEASSLTLAQSKK